MHLDVAAAGFVVPTEYPAGTVTAETVIGQNADGEGVRGSGFATIKDLDNDGDACTYIVTNSDGRIRVRDLSAQTAFRRAGELAVTRDLLCAHHQRRRRAMIQMS